jgi:hypothetical protein
MPKRRKKSTISRYALSGKRHVRTLLFDKKAVSVVISTIVLTAGVLAMGIAILYWAYSWGNIANHTYSTAEENSAKAVQERLGFEYIDYSGNILTVNIINWGTSNNVTIASVRIYNSAHQYLSNYTRPTLRNITTSAVIPFGLPVTGEGYFRITPIPALGSGLFYIQIVTDRGRTFDGSFATP